VAVMVYQQPALSMISIVVAPIVVLGIQRILKQVRLVMSQEMAGMGEIIKVIQETSGGARIIKAFNLEDRMHGRMNSAVDTVESRANRMKQLQAATMPLLDTVAGLAVASIVILSATPVFGQEPGSAGQLMSFVTAFLMSYEPASRLSKVRVVIESGMVGVRMMYNLLDAPQTLVEAPDAVDLVVTDGEIAFDEVGFTYVGDTPVLQNLSVTFAAGKTTALVGPSGGGKSSIMNLILRLYDPKTGAVRVDGQDLKTITFRSLRENIAFVGQDTFLFSGTVRENLLMAKPDATDEEIETAAKVANAHDFIMSLPKGYRARIGENGSALSGGQRQRLSIARAILRDAPILLLDEATSALDSLSEASVKAAIETISNKRTTIIIAHRLSTVLDADQICYVESGEVVERGSFDELMAMGGKFKDLFDAQYKNYDPSQADAIEG
ncbi:MAG: ABC transporter ATP-binding protein, partial [Rhodobacteraceae bacterium]|nr:ABC transporter ATP-binding protein [Paracoccaceae bacterium]